MQQIILPYPINDQKLSKGSIERIDFGAKTFKIKIPEKARFGQMLRLRGLAEHIDDSFRGQDLLLLLKEDFKTFSSIRKDVLVELPINLDSLKKKATKRINIFDKAFDVKIPLTSSYGQTLRLNGLAEAFNGGYPGDILLTLAEQPNLNRGILHKILGNFMGFDTPASEGTFKINFKLPWLFEFGGEWLFKNSNSNVHGNY